MFNLLSSKSKLELLQEKYNMLMEQSFKLEMTNLKAAELKKRKAQQVMMKIVEIEGTN
jgi:hypothetical protein